MDRKKKRIHLSKENEKVFREILTEVCKNSRFLSSSRFMQHGSTSVFRHSVAVAYVSFYIAEKYRIRVNCHALIRGRYCMTIFCTTGMRRTIPISGMDFIMQEKRCRMRWKILR